MLVAQANAFTNDDIMQKVFKGCLTTPAVDFPTQVIPKYTERVFAVDEVTKVDISIPGCPPHPDWIADALLALLAGKTEWKLPERSVCDTCPVADYEEQSKALRSL